MNSDAGSHRIVNFAKRHANWRDVRVKWLLCFALVLSIFLAIGAFMKSRTLSETRDKIAKITIAEKTLLTAMKKRFGEQKFVAILSSNQRQSLKGYGDYLTAIGEVNLSDLWLNEIILQGNPVQITIKGETFEANNVQFYYTQLGKIGPFVNTGLRVSELSGLKELSDREKKRRERLARRGSELPSDLDLEKTFRFVISNVNEKESSSRRRRR